MAVNLVKLCVGVDEFATLERSIARRVAAAKQTGGPVRIAHTTRMIPKRKEELLSGGSLYWVISGVIQARQALLDIEAFKDAEGINRCDLVLSPELIPTQNQPRRAFQGWRYLLPEDAPEDLSVMTTDQDIDPKMLSELKELCLL